MPAKVWIDGKLYDKNDARLSVFDHGLLYGDGVWTGMRVFGGRVFKLREHVDRLFAAADVIALRVPLSQDKLAAAVEDAVRANNRIEGYVRLTVTRGAGTLGLDPRKCDPAVVIIAEDLIPYPREVVDAGLEVVTLPAPLRLPVKTLSYGPTAAAKGEAVRRGFLDALLFDDRDAILGSIDGNVFVVKNGVLSTPPAVGAVFPGITRATVIELARDAGVAVVESPLAREAVHAADEMFITGTAAGLTPVVKVDGRAIGSGGVGPITGRLRERYREAVRPG